nr:GTP-binding protein REM 1 isoform X2 [Taeniopygia guttata]
MLCLNPALPAHRAPRTPTAPGHAGSVPGPLTRAPRVVGTPTPSWTYPCHPFQRRLPVGRPPAGTGAPGGERAAHEADTRLPGAAGGATPLPVRPRPLRRAAPMGQRRRRCCPGDRGLPAGGRAHWLPLPRAGPPGAAPIGCAAAASCCGDRGARGAAPDPTRHRRSPGTAAHRAPPLTGHRGLSPSCGLSRPCRVPRHCGQPRHRGLPSRRPGPQPRALPSPSRSRAARGAPHGSPPRLCALPAGGTSPSCSRSVQPEGTPGTGHPHGPGSEHLLGRSHTPPVFAAATPAGPAACALTRNARAVEQLCWAGGGSPCPLVSCTGPVSTQLAAGTPLCFAEPFLCGAAPGTVTHSSVLPGG